MAQMDDDFDSDGYGIGMTDHELPTIEDLIEKSEEDSFETFLSRRANAHKDKTCETPASAEVNGNTSPAEIIPGQSFGRSPNVGVALGPSESEIERKNLMQ